MAGTKASRHPTKTDILIEERKKQLATRGLNRHRIIPRIVQPTSFAGTSPVSGQAGGGSSNFLRPQGDTMIGPIAFGQLSAPLDITDPLKPTINIGKETDDYSTYVKVIGNAPPIDNLSIIAGASFDGQLLFLQSLSNEALILQDSTIENGGNIFTGGGDIRVLFGNIAQLVFDSTLVSTSGAQGSWVVVSAGGAEEISEALLTLSTGQLTDGVILFDQNAIFGPNIIQTATPGVFLLRKGIYSCVGQIQIQGSGGQGAEMIVDWERSVDEAFTVPILFGTIGTAFTMRSAGDFSALPQGSGLVDARTEDVFVRVNTLDITGNLVEIVANPTVATIEQRSGGSGSGGGGGTGGSLGDLDDVTITNPQDLQHLIFDSGTSMWINQASSGGGLNQDLSNLIGPTIPNININMNNMDLLNVKNLDFDNTQSAISGIRTVGWFQTDNFIRDHDGVFGSSNGLEYGVADGQRHLFLGTAGNIAQFTRNGVDSELNMLDLSSIRDVIDLSFSLSNEKQALNKFSLAFDSQKGGVINAPLDSGIILEEFGTQRIAFGELGGANGWGIQALTHTVYSDAGISFAGLLGSFWRQGGDLFAETTEGTKNLKDIGGGIPNAIQQDDSQVVVIDGGGAGGTVSTIIDGDLKVTQNASNMALQTSLSMNGQDITGTADILPSLNHNNFIGLSTLFYAGGFFDRITLENVGTTIIGSTGGIDYNAQSGGEHDLKVGAQSRLTVGQDQVEVFRTFQLNSNDITEVRDLIFDGSGGLLDMFNGSIISVGRINMATNAEIRFLGGDIEDVRQINMQTGGGAVLNMRSGNIFNVGNIDIEGQLQHEGDPSLSSEGVGFFGTAPSARKTVNFTGNVSTDLAILIQALGSTFQGIGLFTTNV